MLACGSICSFFIQIYKCAGVSVRRFEGINYTYKRYFAKINHMNEVVSANLIESLKAEQYVIALN
jgi:hypothetical protein